MSEVKRFPAKKFHPDSEVLLALHYDAAKSELAALREELAKSNAAHNVAAENHAALNTTIFTMQQRLAAAEQRNASLTTLLREGLEEYKNGDDWIDRVIEALRDQPTESGASE